MELPLHSFAKPSFITTFFRVTRFGLRSRMQEIQYQVARASDFGRTVSLKQEEEAKQASAV
jgi:hypothetical protein